MCVCVDAEIKLPLQPRNIRRDTHTHTHTHTHIMPRQVLVSRELPPVAFMSNGDRQQPLAPVH